MEDLIAFHTYNSADEVMQVAELLRENGIPTEIIKTAPEYLTYIEGGYNADSYVLRIPASDFDHANKLLLNDTPGE